MSDSEIIKGLEVCSDKGGRCCDCPYRKFNFAACSAKLQKDALELIGKLMKNGDEKNDKP